MKDKHKACDTCSWWLDEQDTCKWTIEEGKSYDEIKAGCKYVFTADYPNGNLNQTFVRGKPSLGGMSMRKHRVESNEQWGERNY